MIATPAPPSGSDYPPAEVESSSEPEVDQGGRVPKEASRWRPGVRLLLTLVVLLPMLSAGILITSSASSAWGYRQHAGAVATDAARLEVVASARAHMNSLELPLTAVSYARQVGISEPELDTLLHPTVPFRDQITQQLTAINRYPTFSSTSVLQADVAALPGVILGMAEGSVAYGGVRNFLNGMATEIDRVWSRDYQRLQADIAAWQPPGSFEVHTSTLRQTYQAFQAGGHEIEGAIYVLEGTGPSDAKQELIQASGVFDTATAEFAGQLSPKAYQAWHRLQTNAVDRHFAATVQQGLTVVLKDLPPPFVGNVAFAGASMAPALHYLADLNALVTAASRDLHNTALTQASAATHRLIGEIIFLGLLALVCLGGVLIAGRTLTRPLKKLAAEALQVHRGEFDLDRLSGTGPREIVTTTAAFNDMAATLRAVEAKAVALAAEDLSDPELQLPLPGRTGQALQASVDKLATRIRERELQRQLLHEAATHDGLTGLLNRAAVLDYLTHDVSRRRESGETVAVLFIDLDGLKPLNDTYGHEAGDAAIFATAVALMQATDKCDVVGRLGGDEFLVVLCHEHSCDGDAVVARIRESVSNCSVPVGGDSIVPLEASLGVALAQCDPDTDPMMLVRQADEAMYEAKRMARADRDRNTSAGG
jgi:diguanylate cyclase (GGDEF)-like protein